MTSNIVNILLLIGYMTYRVIRHSSYPWNVLNLTGVLIAGQGLRSPKSFRLSVPALLFTAKIGILADSLFAIENSDIAAILSALFCVVWILVPQNPLYTEGRSRVSHLETPESLVAFKNAHKNTILLCCDFNALDSVGISHAFADLANEKIAATYDFCLIDPVSTSMCKSLKLPTPLAPTIIQYFEEKELLRQSVTNLKGLKQRLFPIS